MILCKQKSTLIINHETDDRTKSAHGIDHRTKFDHGTDDRIKYDHDTKLRTEGFIKTIINNAQDLYNELRNDFRVNRKLKVYLFI